MPVSLRNKVSMVQEVAGLLLLFTVISKRPLSIKTCLASKKLLKIPRVRSLEILLKDN
ncbi:MAG TPA: hypothetical protein PLL96_02590 [Syntrophorhabdaceae bacterium]|nr:hypothetical protein [Syntrophorhabdaceae bacterium]HPC66167.1 hypothetical protein [Syntrophorhabdaceae bacterium]HRR70883.1 hypothetical protein [Syntrophorhabdaceae bacterium]HRV21729.1 hypothetical protein [Syntrophorhabdaceae bacterium]